MERIGQAASGSAGKLLLLALYLAFDHQAIADRFASLGFSAGLVAYLVIYAALAAALLAAAFTPSAWLRLILGLLLASGSVALHSYEWATGSPLTYNSFETMVASTGDAGDAFSLHADTLLKACGAALILFVAIILPPVRLPGAARYLPLLPAGAVLGLACLLYLRGGEGARALPAPFSPLAQGAIMATLQLTEEGGPRQTVSLVPATRPDGDVVLVIDESVAANYFDINHPAGVYSGLAGPRPGLEIANFGVAASVTNCSTGSNRTLRFGGTRDTYRQAAKVTPSVWAYARRSGLRTVYLDGQRHGGALQNLMTPEERAEIDDFVQLGHTPVQQRDQVLARLLAQRLANGTPEFILVNKVGAHFPVADKFPQEAAAFGPLPRRGETDSIIDMGPAHGSHRGTAGEWRLYRNAYRNTLIWNTGGFFDHVLPRMIETGAVMIYTSDHGQDLHEGGHPGKWTHCINDPRPEEGAVPLVVIDSRSDKSGWGAAAARHHDGSSHFRIFPTLLQLMGYQPAQARQFYGPTLLAPEEDPMTFTPNYFAALGREPTWLRVDARALATPQRSDHTMLAKGN